MTDSSQKRAFFVELVFATFLIAAGVSLRLLCVDLPNFSPVAGFALLAGLCLRNRLIAIMVPLCIMLISDRYLTGYEFGVMVSVYSCFLVPVVFGRWGRNWITGRGWKAAASGIGFGAASGLASSLLFFVVTNFAYWLSFEMGHQSLWTCFLAAIPFFKYTLAGDLFFCVSFVGVWAVLHGWLTSSTFGKKAAAVS